MSKAALEQELKDLQYRLNLIHQAMGRQGRSAVIVLEGQDASGKGGLIRRLAWCLDPRWIQVWPISAPDEHERREHWLQRFWRRVPRQGRWAVFDRSWYGRVLVERVERLTPRDSWQRAYREINEFEQTLTEEHIKLVKIWLDVSPEKQLERFEKRFDNPAKQWKLTREDLRNRERREDYQQAQQDMFNLTNTAQAPWHRIDGDHKSRARVACFQLLVDRLGDGLDLEPPPLDPQIRDWFESREPE